MGNSREFQLMLDKAIECEPLAFKDFDRTKNVQDQLQEMLIKRSKNNHNIQFWFTATAFFDYWIHLGVPVDSSMEQLWLAFVMKEKYNKTWNGEKWVCDS